MIIWSKVMNGVNDGCGPSWYNPSAPAAPEASLPQTSHSHLFVLKIAELLNDVFGGSVADRVGNRFGNKLGVTCCDGLAGQKASRPGCVGKEKGATFAEAEAHCEKKGKMLCSAAQIEKGAGRGKGCMFDGLLQWTRDGC